MILKKMRTNRLLEFKAENDQYSCEGITLDLSDSPLSSKLFSLFTLYPNEVIRKEDVLAYVYNIDPKKKYSKRFMETYVHNAVKLVSRARRQAGCTWAKSEFLSRYRWFCFDNIAGGWRLYIPKEERVSMLDVV